MNRNFSEVERELSADEANPNWQLLSISFDPEYDTPERLGQYALAYQIKSGQWSFATGAAEEIRKLGAALGISVAGNDEKIAHTLRTVVIDGAGCVQKTFSGNKWKAAELIEEIRRTMAAPVAQKTPRAD